MHRGLRVHRVEGQAGEQDFIAELRGAQVEHYVHALARREKGFLDRARSIEQAAVVADHVVIEQVLAVPEGQPVDARVRAVEDAETVGPRRRVQVRAVRPVDQNLGAVVPVEALLRSGRERDGAVRVQAAVLQQQGDIRLAEFHVERLL
jgi:hypothetical protein